MNNFQRYNIDAAIHRAAENNRNAKISNLVAEALWSNADREFCDERYVKDKDRKGTYTAVEHWDGVHIVMNENMVDEHIFNTEFESLFDAAFSIKTHDLPTIKPAKSTGEYY